MKLPAPQELRLDDNQSPPRQSAQKPASQDVLGEVHYHSIILRGIIPPCLQSKVRQTTVRKLAFRLLLFWMEVARREMHVLLTNLP